MITGVVFSKEKIIQFNDFTYRNYTVTCYEMRSECVDLFKTVSQYVPRSSSVAVYSNPSIFYKRCVYQYELMTSSYINIAYDDLGDTEKIRRALNSVDYLILDTDTAGKAEFWSIMSKEGYQPDGDKEAALYTISLGDGNIAITPCR